MMKAIFYFGCLFFLFPIMAQNVGDYTDMDDDGIMDTIYIDAEKSTIVCKLSSRNFESIMSREIEILNETSDISIQRDSFTFGNHWMRAGYYCTFAYDKEVRRVRVVNMSRYEFGNAANDGSGESRVDLETGEYEGNWNYYDMDKEELVSIPTISTIMSFSPIYLEDFDDEAYFGFGERCAELYHQHKEMYQKKNNE